MEIRAGSKYDFETIKAFTHVQVYKKKDPRKAFVLHSVIWAILTAVLVLELVFIYRDGIMFILLGLGVILFAVRCFTYFKIPQKQYKAMGSQQNLENEFIFCDDVIKISSSNDLYSGTEEISYSAFFKVMETSKYMFIFRNQGQGYIVDKSTVTEIEAKAIREKLSTTVSKYITCKY